MYTLRRVLVFAVVLSANLFLSSQARADSFTLHVLNGSVIVHPGVSFGGATYDLSGEGFTLNGGASDGLSSAFCSPCLVGDSLSASLSLSRLRGALQHNGRTHEPNFTSGNGGILQFFAPTLTLQPGSIGSSVTFQTPVQMGSDLIFSYPPFAEADIFRFSVGGQGIATLTYEIFPFPEGPAGQQFVMREFRFDFGEQAAPVPEPTTMLLLGSGLAGLGIRHWKLRKPRLLKRLPDCSGRSVADDRLRCLEE
jgi:hypothetical protein